MSTHSNSVKDLSVQQALQIITQHASPITDSITIPSFDAVNYLLADKSVAQKNIPERDNSAMDGFVFFKE